MVIDSNLTHPVWRAGIVASGQRVVRTLRPAASQSAPRDPQPRTGRCAAEKEKRPWRWIPVSNPLYFGPTSPRVTKHGLSTTRARGYFISEAKDVSRNLRTVTRPRRARELLG